MADRKLFDRALVTTPVGTKRIAIGEPSNFAENITLNDLKTWMKIPTGATKQLIVPIGAWNMNSTATKALIPLSFPLQPGQIFPTYPPLNKIRGVRVSILNDAGTALSDFLSVQNGTDVSVPLIQVTEFTFIITSTNVTLTRKAGGFYATSTDYNDGVVNRGWIIADYFD